MAALLEYPKNPTENLQWRYRLWAECKKDKRFQNAVKELFFKDPLFAFNTFFFTLDVRKRPFHNQPFCTWPYQDKFLLSLQDHIDTGRDILVEKSRDMGASWLVISLFFWNWLKPGGGYDFLLGSRIEDYVDKRGDMRTLMEKARYLLYKLPKWLMPKGFKPEKHDNYMRLFNPEGNCSLTGESNNANFSTGGRYSAVLFDEFAKWDQTDVPAWTAAGDATPCRVPVSTPFGAAGQYYELTTDTKTDKVTLHWSLHPEKGANAYCVFPKEDAISDIQLIRSPWFDKECERRRPLEIAQELQIDYIGSGSPVFDGDAAKSLLWYMKNTDAKPRYYDLNKETYVDELIHDVQDGILLQYERYEAGHTYVMGSDVAEGLEGGDYSTVLVLDIASYNIVAVYHAQTDEVTLASYIKKVSDLYSPNGDVINTPLCAIETNGPGLATFDRCEMLEMTNLFMMPNYDSVKQQTTFRKGWKTTQQSKPAIVASIREYLTNRLGALNYMPIIKECMTFVRDKRGKPAAKTGCNDDLVITLGICLEVAQFSYEEQPVEKIPQRREDHLGTGIKDNFYQNDRVYSIQEQCLQQLDEQRALKEADPDSLDV